MCCVWLEILIHVRNIRNNVDVSLSSSKFWDDVRVPSCFCLPAMQPFRTEFITTASKTTRKWSLSLASNSKFCGPYFKLRFLAIVLKCLLFILLSTQGRAVEAWYSKAQMLFTRSLFNEVFVTSVKTFLFISSSATSSVSLFLSLSEVKIVSIFLSSYS